MNHHNFLALAGAATLALTSVALAQTFPTTPVVGSTPDQFQKMIVTEISQWATVVKAAGIKAD